MRSVLYVQYADPALYPPTERGAEMFRAHGWGVSFLGIRASGDAAGLVDDAARPDTELLTHEPGGFAALKSYLRFWWRAFSRVRKEKPDVVYCCDITAYPAGLFISMTCPAATVLHEHDPPIGKVGGPLSPFLAACRKMFARRADLRVMPQKERAEAFRKALNAPPVTIVHNCPAPGEITTPHADTPGEGLVLWHHGSLNAARFPAAIIEALALLPQDVRLEVAGYETESSIGYMQSLQSRAKELGVAERFTYLGPMPRAALFERARRADIGIVLLAEKFGMPMVGASVKPFDYLACGLPLLTNDTPEWRDFFVARDVARAADPQDPQAIAEAIGWFHDNPAARREMARHGHELMLDQWNYDAQFAPVLDQLARIADKKCI